MTRGMPFLHLKQNHGEYEGTFVEWVMLLVLLYADLRYVRRIEAFGVDNNEVK